MLPLYLSIEGLYSYQAKQEIDFKRLTETGLFGIFGNVGSGKSAILEAIGFVLYGETERLNKQEKRTYNMLNLKSDAACIVFEFLNFEQRKFRFVAQWKRKKKFEETSSLERYAYEWLADKWVPMESAEGSLVTNLTYANFRRTIIIPQGQFKEFLELKGKDRSDMMKEIFNLNRFDLGPKTAILQRKNNSELEHLKGALSGFESVSVARLQEKQLALSQASIALSETKKLTLALEQLCKQLSESQQNRLLLNQKKEELAVLNQDKPRIEQLDLELKTYETTHRVFRELINISLALGKDKEQLTYKLEKLSVRKRESLEQLEKKEQEWHAIAEDFSKLAYFRAEAEDLKLLVANVQHEQDLLKDNKRYNDGKPFLEKEQERTQAIQKELLEKEAELEALKNNKVDTAALLALETWYQSQENFRQQIKDLEKQTELYHTDIEEINKSFQKQNLSAENWEAELALQEKTTENKLLQLQEAETHLQVQLKLAEFSSNLEDGHSCPLCGSLDHPAPMQVDNLSVKAEEMQAKKKEILDQLSQLKLSYNQLTRASTSLQDKRVQQQQLQEKLVEAQKRQAAHHREFQWKEFDAMDKSIFLSYKDQSQRSEHSIKQIEEAIKLLRQSMQDSQAKAEKYKGTLAEIEQNIQVLKSLIAQNIAQLRMLRSADFVQVEKEVLLTKQKQTADKVQFLEESHKRISEVLQQLKTELATVNAERTIAKEQFQKLAQDHKAKQAEISTLLSQHGYSDIIQVQQVLQKNLNSEEIRQRIQDFVVKMHHLQQKIDELQTLIHADQFSESAYKETLLALAKKQEELELQTRNTGALERECAQLQVEVEKKERLLEIHEKLSLRKSNLTTLENLFRGAGFVNYVSSIHLQRLCSIANQRFHRLTRNSLSLTINEANEFEVIDYLHNGFRRSVKTLSGGQSFQASLCLALALAENIQSLNKADRNFFFIDEGFGTQDSESINTVFETLQYLHKENRIVGIISHVEELKERIPSSISIVNDKDQGSQIKFN